MVDSWRAWANAWTVIGKTEDERRLIGRVLSGEKFGCSVPSRRTVRATFATVFSDGRDKRTARFREEAAALPAALRTQRVVFGFVPLTDDQAVKIREAVAFQSDRFLRLCRFYEALDAEARDLPVNERWEALLGIAAKLTYEHEYLNPVAIEEALRALEVPGPEALRTYLEPFERRRTLEEQLAAAWESSKRLRHYEATTTAGSVVEDRGPLWSFLGVERLVHSDDSETWAVTAPEDFWEQAKSAVIGPWPPWAFAVHLTSRLPMTQPPLRSAREVSEFHFVNWLDESIEARLGSAMRGDRAERRLLPAFESLVKDEIERACMVLGVGTNESRVLLVLADMLTQQISVEDETNPGSAGAMLDVDAGDMKLRTTRAADHVRSHLAKWKKEREEVKGFAGIPHVWASTLADPTPYFVAYLWTRLHNGEVKGSTVRGAREAFDLLTGIGHTLTDRLKSLPASAALAFLVPDYNGVEPVEEAEAKDLQPLLLAEELESIRNGVEDRNAWSDFWARVYCGDIPEDASDTWSRWRDAAGSDLEWSVIAGWLKVNRPGNGSASVDERTEDE